MRIPDGRPSRRVTALGTALGIVGALSVAGPAVAAAPLTLNVTYGPSGGGNAVTLTSSAAVLAPGSAVEFQYAGSGAAAQCSSTYATPAAVVATGSPSVQSAGVLAVPAGDTFGATPTKIVVRVPATVALDSSQSSASYHVCVYGGTAVGSSTLIANTPPGTPYRIAGYASITAVSPTAVPSAGGTRLTVTGWGFPSVAGALTAALDGVPLTNIVVAPDGTSFSGIIGAHLPGPAQLTVTTPAGDSIAYSDTGELVVLTYTDTIAVAPNTSPSTAGTRLIDITGTGIAALTFGDTSGAAPNETNAHVFLVDGTYNPADAGGSVKTTGPIAECTDVHPVGDTELFCSLDLTHSYVDGVYATGDAQTLTDATITDGDTTLGSPSGFFTADDVGRIVVGPSIPPNTVITAVTDGSTVEMSQAATASITATADIAAPVPVRDGAYTLSLVSNGGVDVQPGGAAADPGYRQSVIFSGSTFTVAPF